ncbi:hypothetical protein PG997_007634 [Apiospora hydei]|uniref:Uncharacterized protein n=1 Tax=Apiospora hydei TaxID=1337664 RepID=A0ABR1W8L2_9PEZI
MSASTSLSGAPGEDPVPPSSSVSASLSVSGSEVTLINPDHLAEELWTQTCDSLARQYLRGDRMTQDRFSWLLPKPDASEEVVKIYRKFQQTPMIVSMEELGKVLSLEESTQSSPVPRNDGDDFYVRSWAFTGEQLESIMEYLIQDGKELSEFEAWCKVLTYHEAYAEEGKKFTIRFIGTCQLPARPIDRFLADLSSGTSGILPEFQTALECLFPNIPGQVHILVDANVNGTCSHNVQDAERILVEFFGHETLLNRHRSGHLTSIMPENKDVTIFQNLETNYYHCAFQVSGLFPTIRLEALERQFDEIQELANVLTEDTGTKTHPFTDSIKRVQLNQATPTPQYDKLGTLMVFIGNGFVIEDYVDQRGFMTSKSRAAGLTKALLTHLARTETQCLDLEEDADRWTGTFDTNNLFHFYDLWPWPKHVSLESAAGFLQKYLLTTRPLIVNTYSQTVSSIARANFLHEFGLPRSSFLEHVGEMSIQYYSNTCWVDEGCEGPDLDTAFINIPHMDPGLDKYGKEGSTELRRVLYMTMQMTFLVASTAMDWIKLTRPSRPPPAGQEFAAAFKEAKIDLERCLMSRRAKLNRISEFPMRQKESQVLMAKIGFSQGEPHSTERHDDLFRLWNANIPEMHLSMPHDYSHKAPWVQQLMPLEQGQSYFLAMASQMPEND